MNLIGTPKELMKTTKYLKNEFEVKDLGKTKLYLSLEHKINGILVHQSTYTKGILECFNMDKTHPLSTYMVVRTLEPHEDLFRSKKPNDEILGPEVLYLNAIRTLMYLAQCKKTNVAFAVNLLKCFSFEPTRRHWNGIKHIFRYIKGTIDLGLFYSKETISS